MVNVSAKAITERTASAACEVQISAELARAIRGNAIKKGSVLDVARIAGIQAAKRTGKQSCEEKFEIRVGQAAERRRHDEAEVRREE